MEKKNKFAQALSDDELMQVSGGNDPGNGKPKYTKRYKCGRCGRTVDKEEVTMSTFTHTGCGGKVVEVYV